MACPLLPSKARIAGINHLPWLLGLEIAGQDYMPRLRESATDVLAARGQVAGLLKDDARSTLDRSMVKSRLLQVYGALPVAGDRHVAEFFPFFLNDTTGRGRVWGIERTPVAERYTWRNEAWLELNRLGKDEDAMDAFLAEPSGEAAGEIIAALATGERYAGIMNLPNRGQIVDLTGGVVVETLAVVDKGEVRGVDVGDVPLAIGAILQRHIANQELTVKAALTGSPRAGVAGAVRRPIVPTRFGSSRAHAGRMLAANQTYLPQFF